MKALCTLVWVLIWFAAMNVAPGNAAETPQPVDDPMRELALTLRTLGSSDRLLYVTAHPDDEDAALLAYLRYAEGVETALMTLTRGEGGQNEIGPELFDALGVLRSRELEAAARYTGVTQYYSRAFEFGYSFSVEETFEIWHKTAILRDIVQVIREFQPDVLLTMLPDGDGGGQHHQASARLAAEAFEIAATTRWPELGEPHTTRRLFAQVWTPRALVNGCEVDLAGFDPLLGGSYASVGLASRAAHKCQGMARLSPAFPSQVSRWEWKMASDETPRPLRSLFEGLETPDWPTPSTADEALRVPLPAAFGLGELHGELVGVRNEFLQTLGTPDQPGFSARERTFLDRLDRALWLTSGLQSSIRAERRFFAPGDSLRLFVEFVNTRPEPLQVGVTLAALSRDAGYVLSGSPWLRYRLAAGDALVDTIWAVAPATPTLGRPVPRQGRGIDDADGTFLEPRWKSLVLDLALLLDADDGLAALPTGALADPRWSVSSFPVSCQELDASFPSVVYSDPQVVPDPSIRVAEPSLPVPRVIGASRGLNDVNDSDVPASAPEDDVHADGYAAMVDALVSSLDGGDVEVRARAPQGWVVEPERMTVNTPPAGVEQVARFRLRSSIGAGSSEPFSLILEVRPAGSREESAWSSWGYQRIQYPHIRPGALLKRAEVRCVPFICEVERNLRIGYVDGVGDKVPAAFQALGLPLERLDSEALLEGDLSRFDVIMTGVRAYKVRDDLAAAQGRLMDWVESGGVLLVQYNKFEFNAGRTDSSPFAPFPGTLVGRRRVTVEESPVVVNHPDHPALRFPNRLDAGDWSGWVQERGLYFLDFEDARYQDLLTLEDPWPYNSGEKGGALVAAPHGDGYWVYIGVGLFRQLPAAVPGSYRLLANLLALGGRG